MKGGMKKDRKRYGGRDEKGKMEESQKGSSLHRCRD